MSAACALIVTNNPKAFAGLAYPTQLTNSLAQAVAWCVQTDFRAIFCNATRLSDGGNGFRLGLKLRQQGVQAPLYLMTSGTGSGHAGMLHTAGATAVIACSRDAVERVCHLLWGQQPTAASAVREAAASLSNPVQADQVGCIQRARKAMARHLGNASELIVNDVLQRLPRSQHTEETASALARELSARIGDPRIRSAVTNEIVLGGLIEQARGMLKTFLGPAASMALEDAYRSLETSHPQGIPPAALVDALAQQLDAQEQRHALRLKLLGASAPA